MEADMDQMTPLNPTAEAFLACLARADHKTWPYDFWLLKDALPPQVCHDIAGLPYLPPSDALFNGRRETNNSTRVYFSPAMQSRHAVCKEVADAFHHPLIIKTIEAATRTDLSKGQLRIEYCQDIDGFWLESHLDISVKLFTMLIYLSDDPMLDDAGTDVYDGPGPNPRTVATAPYEFNAGMIFTPGNDTWHGFTKRPIRGVRKSIIVNFVTPDWRAVEELA
jgi:hypothetical protein